jgi:ubiquinone/menaquinone biosynthesis C-methylase UbiE
MMSAHEIRDPEERETFFRELTRLLAAKGQVVVVEHLRDMANMLAYNVGAFHFHTRAEWLKAFRSGS